MKKSMAVFLAAMLVGAVAAVLVPSTAQAQQNQSYGVCYAYTSCSDGRVISCRVRGNSSMGVACNWWVVPYSSVECNGYVATPYGVMWQSYFLTCN